MSETSTPKRGTLSAMASAATTTPVRRMQRLHPKPAKGGTGLNWTEPGRLIAYYQLVAYVRGRNVISVLSHREARAGGARGAATPGSG